MKKSPVEWIKKNYRTVLFWLLVLAIAPVFVEIFFVANIMGAEVALGFFLLVVKDIYNTWQYRAQKLKAFLLDAFRIVQNHPMFRINIYLFHTAASIVVLFLSGSMFYSVLLWYPVMLSGRVVY